MMLGVGKRGAWRVTLSASALLPLLATGCHPRATARLPTGSLAASLSSDIRGTDPGVNRDANTDTVMAHVLEGLVAYDEQGRPRPMLADSVAVSPDGRTYRFRLRDGVRFHNGAPLTAHEVVWSWRRYMDPATRWVCLRDFDGTAGPRLVAVEATGPMEVTFRLDAPQPLFLAKMAALQCGQSAILHPASLDATGQWRAPVATGPYRLAQWVRGERVDLAAFRGYARRPGAPDGFGGGKDAFAPMLRFMVIRDGAARLAALVKGQIAVMPEASSAELQSARRYATLRVATAPGGVVNAILLRPTGVLADPRVRRALALSIDRTELTDLATAGTGSPNASLTPTASPSYDAIQRQGARADPAAARRLLAEAGYRGAPIELVTNRRYSDMFDQALLVQAMARRAGLNVRIRVAEWATQMDAYGSGRFEMMSFAYSARSEPVLTYDSIIGDRSKSPRKQWDTPVARALLAQAEQAADPSAQRRKLDELHERMLATTPLIVLFNPADNNLVSRSVTGFRSWALGRARLWGVRAGTEHRS